MYDNLIVDFVINKGGKIHARRDSLRSTQLWSKVLKRRIIS